MDNALVTSTLLLFVVLALCLWPLRSRLIPERVMPFAELSEAAQQALLRRKLRFRTAAVCLFTLAILALFVASPRGIVLLFVFGGFLCQHQVYCLRRRYPMSVSAGFRPPPHL